MIPRQPIPREWLMTDERIGDALWRALARLPRGGGVVFRHHHTPAAERRRIRARIVATARRRGLVLIDAGPGGHGSAGVHGRRRRPGQSSLVTAAAHDRGEAVAAVRRGATVLFVSPIYPTRSHPGAPALGGRAAAKIVRGLPVAAVALGGMDPRRFRPLASRGFHGWAAIDAWLD